MAKLTPEACRAARALLKWSIRDLMRAAGVSPNTVTALESGAQVRPETEAKIVEAFADRGIEITNGDGTGARATKAALIVRDRLEEASRDVAGAPFPLTIKDLGKIIVVQGERAGPHDVRSEMLYRDVVAAGDENPLFDAMDRVMRECGWQP